MRRIVILYGLLTPPQGEKFCVSKEITIQLTFVLPMICLGIERRVRFGDVKRSSVQWDQKLNEMPYG